MLKKKYLTLTVLLALFTTFYSCEDLFGEDLFGDDDEEISDNSSSNCSIDNYSGPSSIDKQYDYQCQAAYIYKCQGETDALRKQCAYYKQLQQSLNLPDCDYCD